MRPQFLSVLLFAALIPNLCGAAPARVYDRPYLESKVVKFSKMRNGGFTMAGIGAVSLISGIILASNGEWEKDRNMGGGERYNAQDPSAAFGVLFIGLGIPLTVGGIVLGSIGSNKVGKYEAMLQGMSLDLHLGKTQGARLAYRF